MAFQKSKTSNNLITRSISSCSILLFISFFLAIGSCREGVQKTLPSSTGKTGEIIVALEDRFIGSTVEEAIRGCLESEHPALPQPEERFRISIVPKTAFLGLLKNHKNILIVETGEGDTKVSVKRNVWALPQLACRIKGNSEKELTAFINKEPTLIANEYTKEEHRRLIAKFEKSKDLKLEEYLIETHSLSMAIPKGFSIAANKEKFSWIRKETAETSIGLLVYEYPYKDSSSLFTKPLIAARDSVTKLYVPGPAKGSYMSTMKDFIPISRSIYFDKRSAVELKGLWKVIGDFMGGPFISYSIADLNTGRIVCIEGYVYAPKYSKRGYVLQIESILLSMKIQ